MRFSENLNRSSLFMGARLRVGEFLADFFHRLLEDTGYLSRAVALRVAETWLNKTRSYRYAKELASTGGATIMYFPTPLLTAGLDDAETSFTESERRRFRQILDFGWHSLSDAARADGINLIRQPEATITGGLQTLPEFGCANYLDRNDPVHKSAAFGAKVLDRAIGLVDRSAAT